MVAGRGIVHSERERSEATQHERQLHGLQLWLALPQADEETDPAFQHYLGADIPAVEVDLQPDQSPVLPEAPERAVYVVQGQVRVGSTDVGQHVIADVPNSYAGATLYDQSASRVVITGDEPLGHRFLEWNFVSRRKERIAQAKQDWACGRVVRAGARMRLHRPVWPAPVGGFAPADG